MYIRKTSRTNKDGSKVTYLQLAHNEWDPEKGDSRPKILYNFGLAEEVDPEAQIEDSFRTLKQTLDVRPVYHRLAERIGAHVLLCWLTLLLVRVAENAIGASWEKLRRQLDRIIVADVVSPHGRVTQRTELTSKQEAIFKSLDLDIPPRIFAFILPPNRRLVDNAIAPEKLVWHGPDGNEGLRHAAETGGGHRC